MDWTKDFRVGVPPQEADGDSAVITLQFIEALRDAADLERRLGDPARALLYDTRSDKAAQAIRKPCWDEKNGLIADTPSRTHFSQRANALAVWLDVVPQEQQGGDGQSSRRGQSGFCVRDQSAAVSRS